MPLNFFDTAPQGQMADFSQLGALGKIGLVLQNIQDPSTILKYQGALNQQNTQNIINQSRQNELDKQSKLAALASSPEFQASDINGKYSALAAIDPAYAAKQLDYQASQQITPYQRAALAQSGASSALAARKLEIEQQQQSQLAALLGLGGTPALPSTPQAGGMSTPGNIAPNFSSIQPVDINAPVDKVAVGNNPDPLTLAKFGALTGNSPLIALAQTMQTRADTMDNFTGYQPGQGGSTKTGTPFTLDESGKPIIGVSPVPGYVPATGTVPTAEDAKKVKSALASYDKLNRPGGLLERYESAVDKYGSELGGSGGNILSGLKTDINLELKNVEELGALSGPDQGILDAQLYDPTSLGANLRAFTPFASSPTTLTKESISRLKDTTRNSLESGLAVTGYKPLNDDRAVVPNLNGWSVKVKE